MSSLVLIGIAVGLAMDAFAVAVACSLVLQRVSFRQTVRLAWHFGLFQAFMPMIGWSFGNHAGPYIGRWDHWIAFGLLAAIGAKAIYESLYGEEEENLDPTDPTRGWSLVLFSVATSIDALAVGVSLAMVGVSIWVPSLVIGVITAGLTSVGMLLGTKIGARFGQRMEVVGGVVLILIGLRILLSHLLQV